MTIERTLSGRESRHSLPHGIIDTQNHVYAPGFMAMDGGPGLPKGMPDITQYKKLCEWLGINKTVITVANAYQRDNECLLHVLNQFGPLARGVAAISPKIPEKDLARLMSKGIVGARIMDLPGGAYNFSYLAKLDELTSSNGLMIAVQFDGNTLADKYPVLNDLKSNFVIDHHGKFFKPVKPDSTEVAQLKKLVDRGNCWYKIAGCYESSTHGRPHYEDVAAVAKVIAAHAPERVIWGTNWPHNGAKSPEDYPNDMDLLDLALDWVKPEHHKKLLVDNPTELFKFS
jgi:D-galactarolactone isomerase